MHIGLTHQLAAHDIDCFWPVSWAFFVLLSSIWKGIEFTASFIRKIKQTRIKVQADRRAHESEWYQKQNINRAEVSHVFSSASVFCLFFTLLNQSDHCSSWIQSSQIRNRHSFRALSAWRFKLMRISRPDCSVNYDRYFFVTGCLRVMHISMMFR